MCQLLSTHNQGQLLVILLTRGMASPLKVTTDYICKYRCFILPPAIQQSWWWELSTGVQSTVQSWNQKNDSQCSMTCTWSAGLKARSHGKGLAGGERWWSIQSLHSWCLSGRWTRPVRSTRNMERLEFRVGTLHSVTALMMTILILITSGMTD